MKPCFWQVAERFRKKEDMGIKRDLPVAGEFYRHFEGNLYQVIGLANDVGTMQQMVVYWAFSGNRQWYVQSLAEFLSPVDRDNYPDVAVSYRFERVAPDEVLKREDVFKEGQAGQKQPDFGGGVTGNGNVEMREIRKESDNFKWHGSRWPKGDGDDPGQAWEGEAKERAEGERRMMEHVNTSKEMGWYNEEADKIRPELLYFLDAETSQDKLSALRDIRGRLDEDLMTSIELSLDLTPDDKETLERRLSLVEKNLEKRVRYEGGRLR